MGRRDPTHPLIKDAGRYKTAMCANWVKTGTCMYDFKCQFAHGPKELRRREPAEPTNVPMPPPAPRPAALPEYCPPAHAPPAGLPQGHGPPPPAGYMLAVIPVPYPVPQTMPYPVPPFAAALPQPPLGPPPPPPGPPPSEQLPVIPAHRPPLAPTTANSANSPRTPKRDRFGTPKALRWSAVQTSTAERAPAKRHSRWAVAVVAAESDEEADKAEPVVAPSAGPSTEAPGVAQETSYVTASVRRQISLLFADDDEELIAGSSGLQSELLTPRVMPIRAHRQNTGEWRRSFARLAAAPSTPSTPSPLSKTFSPPASDASFDDDDCPACDDDEAFAAGEAAHGDFDFSSNHIRLAALWQPSAAA